ncbi:hypothetical protein [Asticcacaulis taihuensis]|uniref:Uncharacterized protein n=1 Tax=Asticcacaulis taihuensis TaxID=260084 RepID=A0A1G4S4B1_9CAUL|nr:hypothetical protein [Asticcacaulis taihuensis]SCW63485.1 hypothetical protein SAMN02927928_2379 [Asticcacaulis taihuensis]
MLKSVLQTTAIITLTAGLGLSPLAASAQILGGSGSLGGSVGGAVGGLTGQAQGSAGLGAQTDLGGATQTVDGAAGDIRQDVNTLHRQTNDTVSEAKGATRIDGAANAAGSLSASPDNVTGQAAANGNASAEVNPGAITGAVDSTVNHVRQDARTATGQVKDTATSAVNAAGNTSASADAQADAKADVENK